MYVKVRVKAGAKKETVLEVSKIHFEIAVREEAKQNLANKRVIALVAGHFRVPIKQVRIVSGHRSPSKILSLPG
ncbi:hypothetical protein A2943_00225 [Candidatus Adlerbacteria bacterium RIFCSPLOWO2_01_FULL_51_16]|uniref:Uncharacterized protein n=1 Tax=Candidatus Adlerbacteria bacterium RIFCSPLOWO2_01_FULL_51_16 TaxID=1797243 RepID=A0A1F4XF35_9BACT|nr:MAG: hypothetical protein A2943_00225 [Candidatus Adlerbacteria bacterium RIFCSPLOWO2_01_FULL_51_16]